MRLFAHLAGLALTTILVSISVQANPVHLKDVDAFHLNASLLAARDVDCDDISKYSVQWFLNDACKKPAPGTCLFYGRLLGRSARFLAKKTGQTTIWDIWPTSRYSWSTPFDPDGQYLNDPLRCIMNDATNRIQYFKYMSTAMAALCQDSAQFMSWHPELKAKTGLFVTDEFPTLQNNKYVAGNVVRYVDSIWWDGKHLQNYWTRSNLKRDVSMEELQAFYANITQNSYLNKRADPSCGAPMGTEQIFDSCGEAPVNWGDPGPDGNDS